MELTVSRSLVAALVLALQALLVLGSGYELRVMVHAYRNPTGTCHDCFFNETQTEPGCCDRHAETENCDASGDRCDNFFRFCQRALGPAANDSTCSPFPVGQTRISNPMDNSDDVMFADEVFGLDNPMLFTGSSWQGMQVFVEVFDLDGTSSANLVDVFAVDVVISLGPSFTNMQTYNGFYGIGQLDLSFQVNCSENSFGSNCTVECIPVNNNTGHFNCDSEGNQVCIAGYTGTNCLEDVDECANRPCVNRVCNNLLDAFSCGDCLPGFQGSDCSTNIDDCVGIDCGTNRQCIDGINNQSCECTPGFIGDDCMTNAAADNCNGIDCGNGVCQNSNESFTCECNAGYTGQSCSVDINECEENSCSGNRQCVDGIATFTCECNPGFSGENCTTAEPTIEASTNLATIIGATVGGFVGLLLLLALLVLVVALLMRRRRQRSVKLKPAKGNCYEDTLTRSGNTATVNSSGFVGEQHGTAAVILNRNNSEAERELRNPIYGMSIENSYDEVGGATGGAIAAERPTTAGTEPDVERELENPIYGMGDEDDVDDEMVDNNTYGKSDKLAPPTSAKTAPSENEYDAIEGLTYSRVENGKTLDYKDM